MNISLFFTTNGSFGIFLYYLCYKGKFRGITKYISRFSVVCFGLYHSLFLKPSFVKAISFLAVVDGIAIFGVRLSIAFTWELTYGYICTVYLVYNHLWQKQRQDACFSWSLSCFEKRTLFGVSLLQYICFHRIKMIPVLACDKKEMWSHKKP